MGIKFANNASSTITGSISNTSTSITLATGTGSLFPTLTATDYFYATLVDTSNNLEIVKVTARSGDVFTVVRGQDGTTARSYAAGSRIEQRPTAGMMADFIAELVTGIRTVTTATATAGQTTFTISGGYVVGVIDVFLNGILLQPTTDYTATNGTTVVLTVAAALNDEFTAIAYEPITYVDALKASSNLGDLTNTATARTNLGVAIGTNVQAYSANLAAFSAKTAPAGTVVGTTDTQTLTNKTLTDPAMIGTILEDIFAITDGAAFEIDPGNGSIQTITLGANRTPKATNMLAGESVILMVDDGSAYTLTWTDTTFGTSGVSWKTNGGVAPTLNTTGYTVITLWKVGTQVYGARVGDA